MTERVSVEGLRYAQAVAETASFSSAARSYGVSQPALSNGIAKLEDRLGDRLFERSPRGVKPTSFGTRLLPLIERALAALDEVTAEARRWTGPVGSDIRVGVSPLINPRLVACAYHIVCSLNVLSGPRQLVLREANVADLRESLLNGELDLILIPSVGPLPRYRNCIVDSEPVVVVDSNTTETGPVELADLSDKQFILMTEDCGLTTFTRDLFASHNLPMRTYPGKAWTYHVLEEWARLGLGTVVIPESKLATPSAPHRLLRTEGIEVEIFYEAVWDPASKLSSDLEILTAHLVKTPADAQQ